MCRLGGAGMNNVITFPNKVKTLREKIHDGKITNEIKILLLKELDQQSITQILGIKNLLKICLLTKIN